MRLSELTAWMKLDGTAPEIAVAQFRELQHQVPLLYALLSVNAVAVAYSHHGIAPFELTVIAPCFLVGAAMFRLVFWIVRQSRPIDADGAIRQLRKTVVLSAILAVAFVTWSLILNRYGGPYEHAHVAIFIAITVIGCIFCLMHLPQAALTVTAIVTVPYILAYISMDSPVFLAIGVNIFLVTAVMVKILFNNFRAFLLLVLSRGEMERLNRENLRLAHTDALTDLPNRRHFFAELERRVERSRTLGTPLAVCLVDLDHFKPVNDIHGHALGDRILEMVGARMRTLPGTELMGARLGGDEFAFLVEASEEETKAIATHFCQMMRQPFIVQNVQITIGASCGVALFPGGGTSSEDLFDHADYALYAVKSSGRGEIIVYSADHETKIKSEQAIENALRHADLDAEMELYLQPIIDAETGRVLAMEALARWSSPRLGNVSPETFIRLAERSGLIHDLTLVLLRKALAILGRLPNDMKLSFNLSAHDVTSAATMLAIVAMVRHSGVDASRLEFEMTETALLRDFTAAETSIRLLRSLGITVALDDFGSGFSSLSDLHRLSLDRVKIDRSFTRECRSEAGLKLLQSILALCASMEVNCIVEGVEEPDQLPILRQIGYRMFQGYTVAKPMSEADSLEWLASRLHIGEQVFAR